MADAYWRLGLDIGSTTTKGVLIDPDGVVAARRLRMTGEDALFSAQAVRDALVDAARRRDAAPSKEGMRVVTTGYGRALPPWSDRAVTEITCHARGVHRLAPEARLVVEVGGQDAKAIRLGPEGTVEDFAMNDRCAAGTGSFLDVMARRLGTGGIAGNGGEADGKPIPDMEDAEGTDGLSGTVWSRLAADEASEIDSRNAPLNINSTCVVFAESEVVGLVARGTPPARVLRAVARSAAERIALLAQQIRGEAPAVFCGGGAQNAVLAAALAEALGFPLAVPPGASFTGALGAALLA